MATIVPLGLTGLLGSYEASIPEVKGLPVPNTPENRDYWYAMAEADIDRVINILKSLEGKVDWVEFIMNKICENL